MKSLFLILGNQLFPEKYLKEYKDSCDFFMAEDHGLCTYQKHHKLKIVLFLASMRNYRDELKEKGFNVTYHELEKSNINLSYEDKILKSFKGKELISFEIEDKFFEKRVLDFCEENDIAWKVLRSPMFMSSRDDFSHYLAGVKKPFMKNFYERQRMQYDILMEKGAPLGGKWSYDSENRKKLPKELEIETQINLKDNEPHVKEVKKLTLELFNDHPGSLDDFWLPVTRKGYLKSLDFFLKENLADFGKYQDAISEKDPFLFHSLISPGLNMGLILPGEVVEKTTGYYEKNKDIPLNSIEGFIRQVIGWREFIRGIYQEFSEHQESINFWNHKRKLKSVWYEGETGIPPLDYAIKKALQYGYNHHIERLMVISNLMLLCEIDPKEVHDWFMEMYIDSSDWVMGPNVYGMGQFSDGGVFATKPYICGSNYILKMSRYKKGEWCDIMDGLYWRFVEKQREFFASNHRMSMMLGNLDRMDKDRKKMIFAKAEEFIENVTK